MKRFLHFLALALFLLGAGLVAAQDNGDISTTVDGFDKELTQIADAIAAGRDDDATLAELNGRLRTLSQDIVDAGVGISPRLTEIRDRLDQLGPAPEDGDEPEAVKEQRDKLTDERAQLNAVLGQLEELSIRANTLTNQISEARRVLFTSTLSRRYDISAAFRADLWIDIKDRYNALTRKVTSWARFAWLYKSGSMLAATLLSWAVAFLFFIFGRRTLGPLVRRDPEAEDPGYFSRLMVGFLGTLLPTMAFWVFLLSVYALYDYFGVLRGDIGLLLLTFIVGIGVVYLVWQLSEAIFAPRLPAWRLVPVSTPAAWMLKLLVVIMAVTIVVDEEIARVLQVVGGSLPITVGKSLVSSTIVGLILMLIAWVKPFPDADGEMDRPWPIWLRLLLAGTGVFLILASVSGYIGFAEFASKQIVVTGAVLSTMYLGYRASRALARERALVHSRIGQRLRDGLELNENRVDQIALLLGIALRLVILAVGIPVLLLFWGFKWDDISGWLLGVLTQFSIGSIRISITGILAGIFVFLVGFWLTRLFQRWLDGDVLSRSRVDAGVRNSIKTGVGYAGVTLAALVGVSAAGINLSQLALVAGALSLGIGFGLQNIVSNFVSGLILLAERPFKVGDWIEAGSVVGTVRAINVRATEIETFQKKTVILPNSDLINSAVGNWTHRNTLGRIEIPVGVAYKSDPNRVRDLLLEIAQDHPRVLSNPEPFVVFVNFGDSSLDFELRAYLADVNYSLTVSTEIRFAIFERFKAAGIEIPFPQRDVNLHMVSKEDDQKVMAEDGAEFGVIKTSRQKQRDDD